MKKTAYPLVAGAAALALVMTGCSSNGKGGPTQVEGNVNRTASVTVGADEFLGYNGLTPTTYSSANSLVVDRMMPGFGYYSANGEWKHGTDLGDYELVSENPLTVKYTYNDEAKYQGGELITCEDAYLDWVSQNPKWIMDGQAAAGSDEPLFNHVSSPDTYADGVPEGPQCNAGDRSFTITYAEPNPDWQLVVSGQLPSHVVAKKIGMSKKELFEALKNKDFETAKKAAEFWNNWNSPTPGQLPSAEDAPSFGPYTLKEGGWEAGQYITMVPNPDWWGEKPGLDELVIRFIPPEGQVQALANQNVNVIEPQATKDTLDALNGTQGVTVLEGNTMIWEHFDFNFKPGSIFANDKGGLALRQAMAYCIPRQQIVDSLIKPLNANAEVLNSREYFPDNPEYKEVVAASYNGEYDKVDIEKAKAKVAESGIANPVVRIGYNQPNQRRSDEVALVTSSCAQAGITVQDVGAQGFMAPGGGYESGDFDMVLFAWSGSGQIVSGANIYKSNGGQNQTGYNNATVDTEWDKVSSSLDPKVQKEAKKVIEKELWNDLFGIPLFTHPGIAAYTTGMENVERNVTQSGIAWNAEKWSWGSAPAKAE
ncbi:MULTISPECIES: ABC transporter substrate-binding protein [Actinotignum]|uniref:ABC transporter substrate-binding protein n=1 Tax=Actinotignum TaxID=1653174 RepID=UPI00041F2865|nr:ABC transporter substrate-binding protein [Actinotignum schaalii]AIE82638.1 peptide transporter [Actinotignum schaalii]WQN44714.1 ABC transporter substrate-binding protein [Actinotignum schaalii]